MLQNAGKPLPSADMLGWKGSEAFPRSPCLAKADWRLAIDAQTNFGSIPTKLSDACLETFKQINLKTPYSAVDSFLNPGVFVVIAKLR